MKMAACEFLEIVQAFSAPDRALQQKAASLEKTVAEATEELTKAKAQIQNLYEHLNRLTAEDEELKTNYEAARMTTAEVVAERDQLREQLATRRAKA